MAQTNDRVLAMVREEILKNRAITTSDLFAKAKKLSKEINALDIRQFHARYPLQVKRMLATRKRRAGGAAKRNAAAKRTVAASVAANGKRGPGRPRKTAAAGAPVTASSGSRAAVRNVLLQFAKDIAAAEHRVKFIDVIAGIDDYVERVFQAAR
jgi:hypothetical protein